MDYYVSRAWDNLSVPIANYPRGYNPWGLSRNAYVQGNPETATDPDGHCWPWCTMLIGTAIGAGMSITTQASSGHGVNWGQVGKEAAVGAVSGAITGLAGPEAGLLVHTALGIDYYDFVNDENET